MMKRFISLRVLASRRGSQTAFRLRAMRARLSFRDFDRTDYFTREAWLRRRHALFNARQEEARPAEIAHAREPPRSRYFTPVASPRELAMRARMSLSDDATCWPHAALDDACRAGHDSSQEHRWAIRHAGLAVCRFP